jgi:hypothetical protein
MHLWGLESGSNSIDQLFSNWLIASNIRLAICCTIALPNILIVFLTISDGQFVRDDGEAHHLNYKVKTGKVPSRHLFNHALFNATGSNKMHIINTWNFTNLQIR